MSRQIYHISDKSAANVCLGLVRDLLKTCRRHFLSRFKAGFRQDRSNEIWALQCNSTEWVTL